MTIPEAISSVVTAVNLEWTGDALTYIPGSKREIEQTLVEWSKDPDKKDSKYPALLLFMPVDPIAKEDTGIDFETSANVNIAIVTNTEKNYKLMDRITNVFNPVLIPLSKLFLTKLVLSNYFHFTNGKPNAAPNNIYHYSPTPAKEQNVFAAVLDAIEINGLTLNMYKSCEVFEVELNYPTITGQLLSGQTSFDFETDTGEEFTVEQNGNTQTYSGTATVTGLNDSKNITIKLTGENTYFKFQSDSWLDLTLVDLGEITTLFGTFANLSGLASFQSYADTSNLVNINTAWGNCTSLKVFPLINFSTVTDVGNAWGNCTTLETFEALDFSSLVVGTTAFLNCLVLTQPPPTGTDVRNGNDAIQGIWTK